MIQQSINQALSLAGVAGRLDPNYELKQKQEEAKRTFKIQQKEKKLKEETEEIQNLDYDIDPKEYKKVSKKNLELAEEVFKNNPSASNYYEFQYLKEDYRNAVRSLRDAQKRKTFRKNTLQERMDLLRNEEYMYETGGNE